MPEANKFLSTNLTDINKNQEGGEKNQQQQLHKQDIIEIKTKYTTLICLNVRIILHKCFSTLVLVMRKSPISQIVDEESGSRIWIKFFGGQDLKLPTALKATKVYINSGIL